MTELRSEAVTKEGKAERRISIRGRFQRAGESRGELQDGARRPGMVRGTIWLRRRVRLRATSTGWACEQASEQGGWRAHVSSFCLRPVGRRHLERVDGPPRSWDRVLRGSRGARAKVRGSP